MVWISPFTHNRLYRLRQVNSDFDSRTPNPRVRHIHTTAMSSTVFRFAVVSIELLAQWQRTHSMYIRSARQETLASSSTSLEPPQTFNNKRTTIHSKIFHCFDIRRYFLVCFLSMRCSDNDSSNAESTIAEANSYSIQILRVDEAKAITIKIRFPYWSERTNITRHSVHLRWKQKERKATTTATSSDKQTTAKKKNK